LLFSSNVGEISEHFDEKSTKSTNSPLVYFCPFHAISRVIRAYEIIYAIDRV